MATIRLRATGPRSGFDALITALHGVDGVHSAEELADLMPHMDDDDSSSAGLPDDMSGSDVHAIEIEVASPYADSVRAVADEVGARHGLVLEYVDDF
ncbi:MAG: hypothetical protein KF800_15875 [Lysobacter sp.]|nr:hypothetical protein [Lysobacter sp.]